MTTTDDTMGRLRRPELTRHSVDLILASQAETGAYPASPNYPTYRYSWLRDGAFIAHAMDLHARQDSAAAFHHWVADTISRHQHKVERFAEEDPDPTNRIDDRHVLHTRYTLDGEEVTEDWGSFQLDGYGFWLTSLTQHLGLVGEDPTAYRDATDVVVRYLSMAWQRPCFDCWEEFPTRHHSTTWAAIAGGLANAGRIFHNPDAVKTADLITDRLRQAHPNHVLTKFVYDNEHSAATQRVDGRRITAVAGHERTGRPLPPDGVDASALLVMGEYGPFPSDDRVIPATIKAIEDELVANGGVHRYCQDEFYGGGQWPVLAGAYAKLTQVEEDHRHQALAWIEKQADDAGNLPEQVPVILLNPNYLEPWVERWGPIANPLLWSHAMYLIATHELSEQ